MERKTNSNISLISKKTNMTTSKKRTPSVTTSVTTQKSTFPVKLVDVLPDSHISEFRMGIYMARVYKNQVVLLTKTDAPTQKYSIHTPKFIKGLGYIEYDSNFEGAGLPTITHYHSEQLKSAFIITGKKYSIPPNNIAEFYESCRFVGNHKIDHPKISTENVKIFILDSAGERKPEILMAFAEMFEATNTPYDSVWFLYCMALIKDVVCAKKYIDKFIKLRKPDDMTYLDSNFGDLGVDDDQGVLKLYQYIKSRA